MGGSPSKEPKTTSVKSSNPINSPEIQKLSTDSFSSKSQECNTAYCAARRKRMVLKPPRPLFLSEKEKKEFLVYFRRFDKDKDDALSFDEFQSFLKQLNISATLSEAHNLFVKTNTDGNRKIDFEEFLEAFVLTKNQVSRESLERAFQMCDINGDGLLTREELYEGLQHLGTVLSEEAFDSIWSSLDKNNDKRISVKEFIQFLRN